MFKKVSAISFLLGQSMASKIADDSYTNTLQSCLSFASAF